MYDVRAKTRENGPCLGWPGLFLPSQEQSQQSTIFYVKIIATYDVGKWRYPGDFHSGPYFT